jgi:hypothetical protein
MAEMPDLEPWRQLGRALRDHRAELAPGVPFDRFTKEHVEPLGIKYRTASDLERGERDNYKAPTLRAIEIAYQLPSRWIDRFLAGAVEKDDRPRDLRFPKDPELDALAAKIWAARIDAEGQVLSDRVARGAIKFAAAAREQERGERQAAG